MLADVGQQNIKQRLTDAEFTPHSGQAFGKKFKDARTIEDWYQWILGPFVQTVHSPNGLDLRGWNGQDAAGAEEDDSSALGYGRLVGPVRFSQLRSQKFDCSGKVHAKLRQSNEFECYGDQDFWGYGHFSSESELTDTFGNFSVRRYTCDTQSSYCSLDNAGQTDGTAPQASNMSAQFLFNGLWLDCFELRSPVNAPLNFNPMVNKVSMVRRGNHCTIAQIRSGPWRQRGVSTYPGTEPRVATLIRLLHFRCCFPRICRQSR